MDLDREVGNYIMEFYLPQPLEVLPVPSENPRFQKLVLLKKLEFELPKPFSETALELMERLAEVGVVSNSMRRAYCLVAVDCTLRRVKLRQDATGRNYEFFDVVKRLWRGRIGRVGKSEAEGGLGSELLREWKDMIETAVWDDSVCDRVLKKFEGVSAVEAVKVYVREEWAKMGPSFLEPVAEAVKTDQGLQKIMGVDGTPSRRADQTASGNRADPRTDQAGSDRRASGGRADVAADGSGSRADMAASGSNPRKEMPKPRIKLRDKLVGLRRPGGMLSRKSRGVRIAYSEKTAGGSSQDMRHYPAKGNASMIRVRGPKRMHNNMKKRRPVRRWSIWEEVNLREAVKECGAGNWKLILTAHRDIFR